MLKYRMAEEGDAQLLFEWANDTEVRHNSYNSDPIQFESHMAWYKKRLHNENFYCYIFSNDNNEDIGVVRIEKEPSNKEAIISISVDHRFRGKGHSIDMLKTAADDFLAKNNGFTVFAYIFKANELSYKSFLKVGFEQVKEAVISNIPSFILSYRQKNDAGN